MKNVPKIKIKESINTEDNLFLNFLHHPYYPQHRFMIFKVFPELKILLKTTKNKNREKLIVKKFILDFHKKHKKIIKQIIKKSNILIEKKWDKTIRALADLMDHSWPQPTVYKAIPTILPFSPLGNNIFYFSILGQIKEKNDKNIIFIAIHEISHFIFYDFLKKFKRKIPEDLKNYFKETLTTILLNKNPLCDILNLRDYNGNPEIRNLRIKMPNGIIISFTEFIDKYYETIKIKNKKSFEVFIKEILNILLPINKEFSKKRVIWNRFGKELSKNPKILKAYQQPIQLKKGKPH